MALSLVGEQQEGLVTIAEDTVTPYLERSPGVASVSIAGARTREIQVELDSAILAQYGLSTAQIIGALNAENSSSSAGSITKGTKELQVRFNGEFESVEDVENMVIKLSSGEEVTLADLGTVNDTFKKESTSTLVDGEPALLLSVMKQSDGNTVEVADGMYEAIEDIKERLPEICRSFR